ncbi:MAG: hypothetical protein GXO31_05455 [Epsilonproteobacteria bacterium]|nr:hypothetical protein [Campylobacterota bacterium]
MIKIILLVFLIGFLVSGCAVKRDCRASFCNTPTQTASKTVIKKVGVSECPRRVKTVVYNDICTGCKYPVSVRENNCCAIGGCK